MATLGNWGEVEGQQVLFTLAGAGTEPTEDTSAAQSLPVMSDEAARWIRRNVWTEYHRKWNGGPRDWFRCRCQWGRSGNCEQGEHRWCTEIRAERPITGPDTYLTVSGNKRLFVAVWLADRTCSWTCPCSCGHRRRKQRRRPRKPEGGDQA
ncbi:DUF6248 family natural product biosynthesis protein [Amycolatopsis sp. NPDC051903]|uniref:DUF6248 family natural product biosynthesis protein n=1 Tax=Amycolatopsis sp. NPDC051903 TaxID=3363936 RepID=UPI0037B7421A